MSLYVLKVFWMIKLCNSLTETTSESCSVHQKLCLGVRSEAVFHTQLCDSSQLQQAIESFLFCFLIHVFSAPRITKRNVCSAQEKRFFIGLDFSCGVERSVIRTKHGRTGVAASQRKVQTFFHLSLEQTLSK